MTSILCVVVLLRCLVRVVCFVVLALPGALSVVGAVVLDTDNFLLSLAGGLCLNSSCNGIVLGNEVCGETCCVLGSPGGVGCTLLVEN